MSTTFTISNGQAIYASLSDNGQNQLGTVNSVSPGQYTVFVYAVGATSFSWSTNDGTNWTPNGNGSSMTFVLNSGQSGTWTVTASNRCDPYRNLTFTTGFGGYGFNIIQDTKTDNIVVKAIPPKGTAADRNYTFNVQISTLSNKSMVQQANNTNTAIINAGGLAKGKYLLIISRGKDKVPVPITLK